MFGGRDRAGLITVSLGTFPDEQLFYRYGVFRFTVNQLKKYTLGISHA